MFLQYGPVTLQLPHTAGINISRVTDATGLDTLYYAGVVNQLCVWNPFATASNVGLAAVPPFDRLGVTLATLKGTLNQDRQQLILTVGNDRAYVAPINDPTTNKPMLCDPAGGPFVDECEVVEVLGDKSAIVKIRIRFAFLDSPNSICTSNRWGVTSRTDGTTFLETRVTRGRAHFRQDFLNRNNPTMVPDQLRAALIINPPKGFIRTAVDVQATEDGSQLVYTVTDVNPWLCLGTNSQATVVEGDATAGVDWPFKTAQGAVAGAIDLGKNWTDPKKWVDLIPIAKAASRVTVYGRVNASLSELIKLGVNITFDRFAPLAINKTLLPVSFFVSQKFDSQGGPVVSVKAEFLPVGFGANFFTALLQPDQAGGLMNLSSDFRAGLGGAVVMTPSPNFGNPGFPASQQTRGNWLSMLVSQVLAGSGAAPLGVPSDDVPHRRELVNMI